MSKLRDMDSENVKHHHITTSSHHRIIIYVIIIYIHLFIDILKIDVAAIAYLDTWMTLQTKI